jgi:hypothetical protein
MFGHEPPKRAPVCCVRLRFRYQSGVIGTTSASVCSPIKVARGLFARHLDGIEGGWYRHEKHRDSASV